MHKVTRSARLCAPRVVAAAVVSLSFPAAAAQPASIPDFAGAWAHPYVPGFELPVSGPGPVTNRSRIPGGPLKALAIQTKWSAISQTPF